MVDDGQPLPEERIEEAQEDFEAAVEEQVEETGKPRDEVEEALRAGAQRKKYADQVLQLRGRCLLQAGIRKRPSAGSVGQHRHPFFKVFYTEIAKSGNPRARQAVDMLLLAARNAELKTKGDNELFYEAQRENLWSPFLKVGLSILDEMQSGNPDEQQEDL